MVRIIALLAVAAGAAAPAVAALRTASCHLAGFETPVRCVERRSPRLRRARRPSIAITAAIVPATTAAPKSDPLFVFAGGPGQAGTDLGPWLQTAFAPARRERDIVLVDFRGTGRSGALDCELPGVMERDYVAAARRAVEAARRERELGLEHYTHGEVVEDIERVRIALGDDEINLWGGSFGTRIAQHYVRTYGAHVRSACSTARHLSARRSSQRHRIRPSKRSSACSRIALPTAPARAHIPRSPATSQRCSSAPRTGWSAVKFGAPIQAASRKSRSIET